MENLETNTAIIGAGAIGLAIARELSLKRIDTIILEEQADFGTLTSSRNSGVIHAGIYYKTNSLKSKLCVEGNKLLYEYAKKFNIPYKNTKKILIASNEDQIEDLDKISNQAKINGVINIQKLTQKKIKELEPLIEGVEGLLIPSSGIIDSISFMRSLIGEIYDNSNMISYNSFVETIYIDNNLFNIIVKDTTNGETYKLKAKNLINSAGIFASDVARKIKNLESNKIPITYYAKGNYFSLNKNPGIKHLIYPLPDGFGLGIHLTLELDNSIKFGPDVEWVNKPDDYKVNESRKEIFYEEIHKYFPSININDLNPSYSGIRPITNKKDKLMRDFEISTEINHGVKNLINLYGIESPGLTSSLALAKNIIERYF